MCVARGRYDVPNNDGIRSQQFADRCRLSLIDKAGCAQMLFLQDLIELVPADESVDIRSRAGEIGLALLLGEQACPDIGDASGFVEQCLSKVIVEGSALHVLVVERGAIGTLEIEDRNLLDADEGLPGRLKDEAFEAGSGCACASNNRKDKETADASEQGRHDSTL